MTLTKQEEKKARKIIDFVYDIEDIDITQDPQTKERAEEIAKNVRKMIENERKIY